VRGQKRQRVIYPPAGPLILHRWLLKLNSARLACTWLQSTLSQGQVAIAQNGMEEIVGMQ
jgi:hypothetical protein